VNEPDPGQNDPTEAEQIASFERAKRATRSTFDARPCLTVDEFNYRINVVEKPALERLIQKGHRIKEIMYYWSDVSAEAHAFPVFFSDGVQDIVNRYTDFFPMETRTFVQNLAEFNKILSGPNGKTEGGDLMVQMRCPLGLYRALSVLDPLFWKDNRNIKRFIAMFPKLVKVGGTK
jgi:hypothetical protein